MKIQILSIKCVSDKITVGLNSCNTVLTWWNLNTNTLFFSISHTTRRPHKEETAGKDYQFVTEEKFEMDIKMVLGIFG